MTARVALLAILAAAAPAPAQSLFRVEPPPPPPGDEIYDASAPLYPLSLFAVEPPQPRSYKVHDLVTIIVDETSRQTTEQNLKTDKKYNLDASVGPMVDFLQLLEGRLETGDSAADPLIRAALKNKFDADGEFERTDRFNARIQAEIIDVKPNGTLVVEARKYVAKGKEVQEIVLSGVCRREDVSNGNTVLSSQLAGLRLISRHEGRVPDGTDKGLIPRVLETIFPF